jgi:uncharacterized protein (UPF0333 family)
VAEKKKVADEATVKKEAAAEAVAAAKKGIEDAVATRKVVGDTVTVGFNSSSASLTRSKRESAPSGCGSLGMWRKPSFVISCTTSVILI